MNVWSQSVAYLIVVGSALLGVFIYRKWSGKQRDKRQPKLEVCVFAYLVLVAVFFDEQWLRFFGFSPNWREAYSMSFAVKWEIAALLATLVISILYWLDQFKKIRKVREGHFKGAVTAAGSAVLFLFVAFIFMYLMLRPSSKDEMFSDFVWHAVSLLLVSLSFLAADFFIWKGAKPRQRRLQKEAQLSVFLVDLPVVLAFVVLALYCGVHKGEHSWFPALRQSLHRFAAPRVYGVDGVYLWTAEEYFISGAIAFQYLISTAIYIILAYDPFEITKPRTIRVRPIPRQEAPEEGRTELPV